jgi:cytochrome c biogenesis protein CcmG, thiol:disulfide interchange protein DsbE
VKRWLAFLPLIVLAALAILFATYALNRNPQVAPDALVGKPMPTLALASLDDGRELKLRELASEGPILVNFFASWCAPCAVEHPQLVEMKAAGVRIVGIAYKDKVPDSQAFLARLGDPFAVRLTDQDGRAGIEFGVTGVPETYAIGRDGMILAKHSGPLTPADAERLAKLVR